MSETWLTVPISELVNITGYNFVSNDRKSKIGGGVGIYLQNIECKILKESNFFFCSEVIGSISLSKSLFPKGKTLAVSFWIFIKRLIPSIMKSYSPSRTTMVSVMQPSVDKQNYFPYRYQFVQFSQTCSPMQTIKCGVPQKSFLALSFSYFT